MKHRLGEVRQVIPSKYWCLGFFLHINSKQSLMHLSALMISHHADCSLNSGLQRTTHRAVLNGSKFVWGKESHTWRATGPNSFLAQCLPLGIIHNSCGSHALVTVALYSEYNKAGLVWLNGTHTHNVMHLAAASSRRSPVQFLHLSAYCQPAGGCKEDFVVHKHVYHIVAKTQTHYF